MFNKTIAHYPAVIVEQLFGFQVNNLIKYLTHGRGAGPNVGKGLGWNALRTKALRGFKRRKAIRRAANLAKSINYSHKQLVVIIDLAIKQSAQALRYYFQKLVGGHGATNFGP